MEGPLLHTTPISPQTPQLPEAMRLRKQILKLRWIGQNDDADRLIQELAGLDNDSILIDELQTD